MEISRQLNRLNCKFKTIIHPTNQKNDGNKLNTHDPVWLMSQIKKEHRLTQSEGLSHPTHPAGPSLFPPGPPCWWLEPVWIHKQTVAAIRQTLKPTRLTEQQTTCETLTVWK